MTVELFGAMELTLCTPPLATAVATRNIGSSEQGSFILCTTLIFKLSVRPFAGEAGGMTCTKLHPPANYSFLEKRLLQL